MLKTGAGEIVWPLARHKNKLTPYRSTELILEVENEKNIK